MLAVKHNLLVLMAATSISTLEGAVLLLKDYWKIDRALLDHIALVSKLKLNDGEKERFVKQLGDVLAVFKQLDDVDVEGLEPAFHSAKVENVWREDRAQPVQWNPLDAVKNKEGGFYKGPRIV